MRACWLPFDICLPGKSLIFTGGVMTANFGAMNWAMPTMSASSVVALHQTSAFIPSNSRLLTAVPEPQAAALMLAGLAFRPRWTSGRAAC